MHPNSFISCVYYFDEIDQSLPLVFHKHTSTPINTFQLIPPFDREKANKTKSAHEHFPIVPNKGDLVFFPSYLYHSIPLNKTSKKRSAMAAVFFNSKIV
jgi:ectoine hydroxylase-related dioxygenase (phytanoyl-CoA dioxygenase family)